MAPFGKMMYTHNVSLTKKLSFIYLAVFSLLNVSLQGQNFVLEHFDKQEIKKYFLQAPQTQAVQRDDLKQKRQVKSYLPEIVFLPASTLTKTFISKNKLSFFRSVPLKVHFLISNAQPRAPPFLS
jgi:hypothetical protein